MRRSSRFRGLAAGLVFFLIAPTVWAQDLHFDEEDIEEIDTTEFEIDEDSVDAIETAGDLPVTTGVIVPNAAMDARTAEILSDHLVDELHTIGLVSTVDNYELRDEFEIMGTELATECAFDPVCLGRVGWDIGLDQVVIGRATPGRTGDEVLFTLDLVDLESRSVLRYRSIEVDNNSAALSQAITTQLPFLFEIRTGPGPVVEGPTGPSAVQQGFAWGTLGLGVVALGVGIFFGLDASSTEDDVRNGALREGDVYVATQREAQTQLDDASDSALMANVFLGTGVALLGVSALLFLITPGSDIDTAAEGVGTTWQPPLSPTVTSDGWGLSGQMRF